MILQKNLSARVHVVLVRLHLKYHVKASSPYDWSGVIDGVIMKVLWIDSRFEVFVL